MADALIEAGTLLANVAERTVTGLLIPYGEVGRTNLGRFVVEAGAFAIPRDPAAVTLNVGHDREQPIGRATMLAEQLPAGVMAVFAINDTPEGDEYLADVAAGKRNRLSPEVKNVVLRGGKAIGGALFGAGAVEAGAFPSAALMAEDVGEDAGTLDGALTDDEQAEVADLAAKISAIAEPTEAPAEDNATSEDVPLMAEHSTGARVPATLNAGATSRPAPRTTLHDVARALAASHGSNDRSLIAAIGDRDGSTLFAALTDITTAGAGAAIMAPQWVGDVWGAKTFERKIVPLLSQAALTSLKIQGFKFTTPPEGGQWAGDKANVPSNTVVTAAVNETASRWSGGHDISREFYDFSVAEFWDAYYGYMANDYAKDSDTGALTKLLAGAQAVAPGTVPAGVNAATALLVDGAIAVLAGGGTPTGSVVAPDVYRGLLLQDSASLITTLALSTGLENSSLAGFSIVADAGVPAGHAIVLDRAGATFYELPGVPIRTTALDQVHGGIDEVMFGYYATVVNRPQVVINVGSLTGRAAKAAE